MGGEMAPNLSNYPDSFAFCYVNFLTCLMVVLAMTSETNVTWRLGVVLCVER